MGGSTFRQMLIAYKLLIAAMICLLLQQVTLAQEYCQCLDPSSGALRAADSTITVSPELKVAICSKRVGLEAFHDFTMHLCGDKVPWITVGDWMIAEAVLEGETLVIQELVLLPPRSFADLTFIPFQKFTLKVDHEASEVTQTAQMTLNLPPPDMEEMMHVNKLLEDRLETGDLGLKEIGWMFHLAAHDLFGWQNRFKTLTTDFDMNEDLASYHRVLEVQLTRYVANR